MAIKFSRQLGTYAVIVDNKEVYSLGSLKDAQTFEQVYLGTGSIAKARKAVVIGWGEQA